MNKKHKILENYDNIRSSNLMILLVAILFPQMFNQIFLELRASCSIPDSIMSSKKII